MDQKRKYDLIIFGASGFTGKFVVEELAKLQKSNKLEPITWAVAGRSTEKLKSVLQEVTDITGHNITKVAIIEADVDNSDSLQKMASQGSVVLNCVGPYRFFGEAVVKACIETQTHHVDVSGEPQFLEKIQLLYNEEAQNKGVYVVGACGYDSIPSDMGTILLKKNFPGDLNSVEMYMEFDTSDIKGTGSPIHYGTWHSAIYGLAKAYELKPIRKELFPEPLPKPKYKLEPRSTFHYSNIVGGWCLPFPGSDKSIMYRTQRYFEKEEKERAAQINTYIKQNSLISCIFIMAGAIFFGTMTQFKCGRYLLENYPRLFSLGLVSHEGPSRERADVPFTITLFGVGWREKLAESSDQHSTPPNETLTVKVRGRNPGYGATCICLIQSAITILKESAKMPSRGGVYTTGAAFSKTSLIDRLNKTGVVFTIEK